MATQIAIVSSSTTALAAGPVQPVPYTQSQPVPYAQPLVPTTPPAGAQVGAAQANVGTTGSDVVVLKSGGMVRGTLIEVIPNDHATVQLATGQNAIIQWDHIHHIERGNAAAPPQAPAPVEAPVPMARVHIESDTQVTLESRETNTVATGKVSRDGRTVTVTKNTWTYVCSAPCDAAVPLDKEYRIAGDGVRASAPFHLAANPGGGVNLDVSAGSKGTFVGGIVLTSLGGLTTLIGLLVVLVGAAQQASHDSECSFSSTSSVCAMTSDGSGTRTAGWITSGIGLGALVGGIVMMTSAKTDVGQQPLVRSTASSDAWKRLPTWREDPNAMAMPGATSVPLLHGSF